MLFGTIYCILLLYYLLLIAYSYMSLGFFTELPKDDWQTRLSLSTQAIYYVTRF